MTRSPITLVGWLIVLCGLVLLGAILGPFGTTSVGNWRFQAFRSHEEDPQSSARV